MVSQTKPRGTSPLLGIYFGIFVAGLVGIVFLLLIFEQLGMSDQTLRNLLLAGSLGLFGVIGAAAYTRAPAEFFLAGRRVPAFFAGLILSIVALGGTGLASFTGILFLIGFDALCILLGVVAGFVAMAMLIAPFLRKFGAITVPAYLGMRFDSTAVRLGAASIAVPALLLAATAELKISLWAAAWLTGLPETVTAALIVAVVVVTLVPGGTRSLTWSSAAQAIAAFLALLVPVGIAAVMITNLPLGQVSHGPVLRALGRTEVASGVSAAIAPIFAFDLPGERLEGMIGRFSTPFSSVGSGAFLLATIAVMLGIAGSPALLARSATTVSIYETRKALGWTVFLVGTAILSFSAIAVFARDWIMSNAVGVAPDRVPVAIAYLADMGLLAIDGRPPTITPETLLYKRDGVLLALPVMMGMPAVLVHLVAAGVLAAALAAVAASITQLGIILVEDVSIVLLVERPRPETRILLSRLAIVVAAGTAGWLAAAFPGDPLTLLLWSLALSGSGLFPVLLLSVWWKRVSTLGICAAMLVGLLATAAAFVLHSLGTDHSPAVLVAAIATPLAIVVAVLVSVVTPGPSRHVLEMVRDLRIPGGETIADREARRALQKRLERR
jgi:cation/acetate symporter